jgi:TetR/AcrR family transcriptional repressor of nem operon
MRYRPEHKVEVHRKILKNASRRVRAEGIAGAAVSSIMRGAGLTNGGFYKHFDSKNELLTESLSESFREIADRLTRVAEKSKPGEAWKAIVKAYLSPEHCDHTESGCPLAALAPDLARASHTIKVPIRREMIKYKSRILPLMPGRRAADKERAFSAIFSTMIGAVAIARILPSHAERARVLARTRDFLLHSF